MKIKDYIFYRLYVNYTKAKHDGIFASISNFSVCEFFILVPLIAVITSLFPLEREWTLVLLSILMLIIFLLNCKRYYKKGRVVAIIRRYRNSKYNTIIKNWMIHSLIFFAIGGGLFGIIPVMKLYKYILSML